MLAVVDFDDRVSAWELASGVRPWEQADPTAPDSARFTGDGRRVAATMQWDTGDALWVVDLLLEQGGTG